MKERSSMGLNVIAVVWLIVATWFPPPIESWEVIIVLMILVGGIILDLVD